MIKTAKTDDLILNYVNFDKHPREIGRYWATDIYDILKNKTTPKNYFKEKQIDLEGAKRILAGMAYEEMWRKVLEKNGAKFKYGDDVKRTLQIANEIILVVKPDFEFPDFVLETKYPTKERTEIPPWYLYQLECEYRVYQPEGKPVKLGIFSYPFDIKYKTYQPDESRWVLIQETLKEFHKQLKLINNKYD